MLGIALDRHPEALRREGGHRPHRRRLALPRVQADLRHHARHRLRAHPRLPGRHPRQQRHPLLRVVARRARSSSSSATRPTRRSSSSRTSPASWSAAATSRAASSRTAPSSSTPSPTRRSRMLTMMVGASYGAGNYGMAGRAYDPRFVFSWPNHRIAVMGPEQLAGVLSIVRRQAAERAGHALRRGRGRDGAGRWCRARSRRRATPSSRPRASGTTASSTRATRARCSASRCRRCTTTSSRGRGVRRLPDVSPSRRGRDRKSEILDRGRGQRVAPRQREPEPARAR